ncbi:MAG: transcription elongation factor GreAB [Leptothrix sp. (in: Bacteria)]|nr:transcription elongation factor GreAB [Leptothrix sp. (in: b-proteobacteria)]
MEALVLERTLTALDHIRLLNVVRRQRHSDGFPTPRLEIEQVLDACTIVPPNQTPPDVVTMQSRVLLQELDTAQRRELTLCYPSDAKPGSGFLSVLSPLGASLLGLKAGSVARWSTPAGEERAAEIVDILFQPEASGDYAM